MGFPQSEAEKELLKKLVESRKRTCEECGVVFYAGRDERDCDDEGYDYQSFCSSDCDKAVGRRLFFGDD